MVRLHPHLTLHFLIAMRPLPPIALLLHHLRPRHTLSLPRDKTTSATRCRVLLFHLSARHELTLPGSNASYTALCRLLLVRVPSRPTLQPANES